MPEKRTKQEDCGAVASGDAESRDAELLRTTSWGLRRS